MQFMASAQWLTYSIAGANVSLANEIPWLRIALVFCLCVLLAVTAVGFLRLRHGMSFLPERLINPFKIARNFDHPHDQLAIVDRLTVGPASQFVVLARGDERYLIHISQHGATVIDQFQADGGAVDAK